MNTHRPADSTAPRGPLAMIVGSGDYPLQLARIVTGRGERPYIAALDGAADPAAFGEGADIRTYRLGQLGSLLEELRRRGIDDAVAEARDGGVTRSDP